MNKASVGSQSLLGLKPLYEETNSPLIHAKTNKEEMRKRPIEITTAIVLNNMVLFGIAIFSHTKLEGSETV